jgi:hypothetical protein
MKRHQIVMNVDFFDEIGLHGDSMGPEDVEELVGRCREAGVDAVFWRAVGLLFFSSWLSAYAQHHQGASAGTLDEAMRMRARTILETGADGICLHEAHTFEYYHAFDTVRDMRRTLDHATASAKRGEGAP